MNDAKQRLIERNQGVIDEFRANAGVVGGRYEGRRLLLLTTVGVKSGRPHTSPLGCTEEGDAYYIFGAVGGAPRHPAWYYNILGNPRVTVEVGTDKFEALAIVLEGADRERVYSNHVAQSPAFAEYEQKMTRVIPVVRLTRLSSPGA